MKRLSLLIIFIAAQIILSLSAGYAALDRLAGADMVRGGIMLFGVDFSGGEAAAAGARIRDMLESRIDQGLASFIYQDTEFEFHFSEIGLNADYSGLEQSLTKKGAKTYLSDLFSAFLHDYSGDPALSFSADKAAFHRKLNCIKPFVDKAPVNADINLDGNGEITKTPSAGGVVFDAGRQLDGIYSDFIKNPFDPIMLDNAGSGMTFISSVEPDVTDGMIADIDAVLAESVARVPDGYDMAAVAEAADAINKVWVPKKGMAYGLFSFVRYLDDAGIQAGGGNSRENGFVASALLHALLSCGADYAKMEFSRSTGGEPYPRLPELGVDLSVPIGAAGEEKPPDFRFSNTLTCNIVIFASAADGELRVAVAGSSALTGPGAAPYDVYAVTEGGRSRLYRSGKKIADI